MPSGRIKREIHIPLVADIHFDYRLAIAAMESGADKIRINPGNIGRAGSGCRAVVDKAKEYNIPIRVGVNSGSLEKELGGTVRGRDRRRPWWRAPGREVQVIEELGYDNLVVSIKSSDVMMCVKAHELIGRNCRIIPSMWGSPSPGPCFLEISNPAVGLGIILYEGIGDTIRVSLTGRSRGGDQRAPS